MKRHIIISLALFFVSFSAWAQSMKAEADSAYINKEYAKAIEIYESLLQEGEAGEVYYNLGNAYFKQDELGRAILNYERALLLQPGNADISANLDIARAKTVDKVNPNPEVFFVAWTRALINMITVDTWGYWGIGFFLCMLASLAVYFFTKRVQGRKIGFFFAFISLILCIIANLFAFEQKDKIDHRNDAIVLSPSVTVRSTPSDEGTSLFLIHEGRKVSIKDNSMKDWKEITLEDGKVGWIPTSAIEII
ncbi:MAG: tetratricopeptide repeat protein [Bacteroidaceae bacterium]|jgi:tetratricopeptide (TPR) repeat protein|nr:tetratricopeptide repeat protein [Bacteroidaceae bacterium]